MAVFRRAEVSAERASSLLGSMLGPSIQSLESDGYVLFPWTTRSRHYHVEIHDLSRPPRDEWAASWEETPTGTGVRVDAYFTPEEVEGIRHGSQELTNTAAVQHIAAAGALLGFVARIMGEDDQTADFEPEVEVAYGVDFPLR